MHLDVFGRVWMHSDVFRKIRQFLTCGTYFFWPCRKFQGPIRKFWTYYLQDLLLGGAISHLSFGPSSLALGASSMVPHPCSFVGVVMFDDYEDVRKASAGRWPCLFCLVTDGRTRVAW